MITPYELHIIQHSTEINECLREITEKLIEAAKQQKNAIIYFLPYFYNETITYAIVDILQDFGYTTSLLEINNPFLLTISW